MVGGYCTASSRMKMGFVVLAAAALVGQFHLTAAAQQPVTWISPINVAVRGSTLEKTGGCQGCDDAGAISGEMIRSGDGYVEFTVGEDNTFWLAGLSHRDGNTRFGQMNFAIRFNGSGRADIMENGVYAGGDTTYQAGDSFRVEVLNGRVRYLKNGQLIQQSQKAPSYPLVLDVALGSVGATIRNARIDQRDGRAAAFGSPRDRFRNLDADGDGVISRREWTASRSSFDELDINNDGVISPRELSGLEPGAIATSGEFVDVSAAERWTDSGVMVRAGDTITLAADGTVQLSQDPRDTATPSGAGRRTLGAPLRQRPAGLLIGRIGNSTPFVVGERRTIVRAPASGRLFLGVNDDFLDDNSGEYRVIVTVEPR
jgi:hypothetical protein